MTQGKVALVTGASRGIGRQIALSLAEAGFKVGVNYSSSPDKANEVVELIKSKGGNAIAVKANVGSSAEVTEMFNVVEKELGGVDVLVNNAGITKDGLVMRMKDEDWDAVIETNLKSTFLCSKASLKHMMKNRWGRIINISSISGVSGNAGQANYAAAKAGMIGFTKSLAREVASRNITVNCIAPGFITTDMTEKLTEEQKKSFLIPLGRFGEVHEIADMVVFMAVKGSYMTGQTVVIDGGMVI